MLNLYTYGWDSNTVVSSRVFGLTEPVNTKFNIKSICPTQPRPKKCQPASPNANKMTENKRTNCLRETTEFWPCKYVLTKSLHYHQSNLSKHRNASLNPINLLSSPSARAERGYTDQPHWPLDRASLCWVQRLRIQLHNWEWRLGVLPSHRAVWAVARSPKLARAGLKWGPCNGEGHFYSKGKYISQWRFNELHIVAIIIQCDATRYTVALWRHEMSAGYYRL